MARHRSLSCHLTRPAQVRCPVTVDLPIASGSCSFGVFRHRKLLGSDLVSSYSAAPEALDLDLQTSNHQVHRRGTRLPPGQPNSRLSKIHWRTLRDFPASVSPNPNRVRHSKFLTAGQALTPRKIICHRTPGRADRADLPVTGQASRARVRLTQSRRAR